MIRSQASSFGTVAFLLGALALTACSGSSGAPISSGDGGDNERGDGASCTAGNETCPCYPNSTCNAGLSCLSGLCVNASGDAGSHDDATTGGDAGGADATSGGGDGAPAGDAAQGGDGASQQSGDSAGPSCAAGALCAPPSGADPCGVYATDCSTGAAVCVRIGNQLAGHACGGGAVCSAQGDCSTCQDGAECVPPAAPCSMGSLLCATGTCQALAATRADGAACGTNAVCHGGVCSTCVPNQSCTPSQGECVQGRTDCSTGVEQCMALAPLPDGAACGSGAGNVCSGGVCTACVAGAACIPANACHTGVQGCGATVSCVDTGVRPDNVYCGANSLCAAGACTASGPWVTHGEDNRTFSGGWVYSFANAGATISPMSSDSLPFIPSPGGRTGDDLEVSGELPIPATNVFPNAAVGWTFAAVRAPVNVGALGTGIEFWIKSAYTVSLQVQALDVWTDPAFPNCSATNSASVVDACYDFPVAVCNVTSPETWTLCTLPWNLFSRPDWGNLGAGLALDASQTLAIQIGPPETSIDSLSPVPFDFAVDDVSFLP